MSAPVISRRKFMGRSAAVGLGVLAHPSFSSRVFGANDRVVLGLIGAGGIGRHHMDNFKELGAVWGAVADVYEVHRDLGLEIAGPGAEGYGDYRRLLERKDLDAVVIATPDHWHHDQLLDALSAGKDVYIEKPLSWSIEQGANMVAAVRKSDRIVQVGMQRRSSPIVHECKKLIDDGALGDINLVRAEWYWNVSLRVRPVLTSKLDWKGFVGPARNAPEFEPVRFRYWRYWWAFSGGNMTDQGTHLMDVLQWFTGASQPVAAQCHGAVYKLHPAETPDTFTAAFEYPKFLATWTLAYMSSFQNGWGLVFHGQKGTLELCETGYRLYREPWRGGRWDRPEPAEEKLPGGVTSILPHAQNFLECIQSRQQPNAPIEIGHQAVRTLHLANIAWHKKTRAVLADDGVTVKT
jgi:predicted dehydrogenase